MQGNYGITRAEDGKRFMVSQNITTSKGAGTAIKVLDSLSSDIGGTFYTKAQAALHKLQSYIDSPFYTRIDVENISSKLDIIEKIEDAIAKQKMVSFSYKKGYKDAETKSYEDVKPYKILIFDGFWYLLVQYKTYVHKYYLKEITNLKVQDKTFRPDAQILDRLSKAHNIYFEPMNDPFDVTLLLEENAIVYFQRKPIKGQYLKRNSDDTAELTISITNKREVFAILKKWLPHAKVIEPRDLQDEFEEILRVYLQE
jgi:predicted DNA-binding transcriptional regulator YafY